MLYFLCMLHGCEITTCFLSLSFSLLCFAVLWRWSTLVLGLCTTVFATPRPLPRTYSFPPLCSSCALSVVYQDGFYGAADLYVSKLTARPTHPLWPSRLSLASCSSFSSGSDSACCVQSCAAQSCLHNGEWGHIQEPCGNTTQSRLQTNIRFHTVETCLRFFYFILFYFDIHNLPDKFQHSLGHNYLWQCKRFKCGTM